MWRSERDVVKAAKVTLMVADETFMVKCVSFRYSRWVLGIEECVKGTENDK